MTIGEMLHWTNRLKNILNSKLPAHIKDQRLAQMMTDLELTYNIPALCNEQYEKKFPFVMQLYRTVSEARSL